MNENTILFSGISLLLIWSSIVWLWKDFFVDDFRQSMFRLRDELFILAVDGEIRFDHPAYGMQRSAMNGMIRFAHRISLSHLLTWHLFVGDIGDQLQKDYVSRRDAALVTLDDVARKKVLAIRMRMHVLVITLCIKSSPILVVLVVPCIVALVLVQFSFGFVSMLFKTSLEALDAVAIVESENIALVC